MDDRRRGSLLDLAIGAAVEFSPPGTFEPVIGYRAGGPHGLEIGEWTDDWSMALARAASIAEVDWKGVAARFFWRLPKREKRSAVGP